MTTQTLTNYSKAKFTSWKAYQAAKRIASNWTGFQRGRKAAISLRKQREFLETARYWMANGNPAMANYAYEAWKIERASYLVLVGWY